LRARKGFDQADCSGSYRKQGTFQSTTQFYGVLQRSAKADLVAATGKRVRLWKKVEPIRMVSFFCKYKLLHPFLSRDMRRSAPIEPDRLARCVDRPDRRGRRTL
jgi:hypothetical protein